MKRLIFFLALLLSFSGCSEFQHMHYRHVKKVPAKGFVEKFSADEKAISTGEKGVERNDSSAYVETQIVNEKRDSVILPADNNPVYHLPFVIKKQTKKILSAKKIISNKLKLKKSLAHPKKGDGSVFLVVVFLFLGVLLMVIGGSMLVSAFYAFTLWLVLLGLVIFLLGLLPFLGLLSFAFGGTYDKAPHYDEK